MNPAPVNNISHVPAIYESELRVMGGLALRGYPYECGGNLFGFYTRDRCPVISLLTGPGPNATCERFHFAQDYAFFLRANQFFHAEFGIEWIGDWHSHPHPGANEPSRGDLNQVMTLTRRNPQIERWLDIIVSFERNRAYNRFFPASLHPATNAVSINAFLYPDPQQGQALRTPLRVLPGMSPLRSALVSRNSLQLCHSSSNVPQAPMERIRCESNADTTERFHHRSEKNDILAAQIRELPEAAQQSIEIRRAPGLLILTIPITASYIAVIGLKENNPTSILRILVKDMRTDETRDLTSAYGANGRSIRLGPLYERLHAQAARQHNVDTWSKLRPLITRFWRPWSAVQS